MATKQEIKDIKLAIETHRTTNPNMANGLIQALAIVNDDDEPDYIPVTNQAREPSGSFACALRDMFNGQSVRRKGFDEEYHIKGQRLYCTSDLRGRETLKEIPLNWVVSDEWEQCDGSS